ncbi:para-nitrobenzyl esterase [Staphylococcus xylosus]|uniref:carboxylesterase family protein n=1 Tax=Staphylococcus xylosus TaxID=1288 RepID=UPI0008695BB8|nr:carboxylesterase family protein [Staphylococcus xylosus]SCU23619.1 para-nitrobenzyl esterase [Staphylococcus xylosus]
MINQKHSNVEQWLGIPYAKAERFQKPVKIDFDSNQDYSKSGPAAMQTISLDWLMSDQGMSEDCLNLSIWAPVNRTKPLPIAVYIHGGGWTYGSNTQDNSDMSGLVSSGEVIGVAINYRLGALGWLSLSQYGGSLKDATNLGMQDIVVALEWIQENISKFGGNPNQVTLTGHSAGAYNSLALLGVKGTEGLFNRIAAFSGFPSRYIPRWFAEELAYMTMKKLKVKDPEELLTIDADKILRATASCLSKDSIELHGIDNKNIGMVADWDIPNGAFEDNPQNVIKSGQCKDIDILISSTTDEVGWYVLNNPDGFDKGDVDNLINEMVENSHVPRLQAKNIFDFHKQEGMSNVELRSSVYTSLNFILPATRAILNHAKAGGRAYQLSIGPSEGSPAVHGTEMYGIVGQVQPGASEDQVKRDQFVTETVLNMTLGKFDKMWNPVIDKVEVKDIGHRPYEGTVYNKQILELFSGIDRT